MASRSRRFRYVSVEGKWYRLVRRGRDPLDFARTRTAGGRYNPPRSHPSLYLADQPATCLLEVLVHAHELPPEYDLISVDVRLARAVDLWSESGRKTARASVEELTAPPQPIVGRDGAILGTRYGLTWEVGRLAWARGADGLLVPSAALPAQRVLVAFERPGARLRIREGRPIPTDPRMRRLLERESP